MVGRSTRALAGLSLASRVLVLVGGLVGLVGIAWVGLYVAAGSGISKGATVLGVPIGGQSRAQAAATLERELADEVAAPIPVIAGGQHAQVRPSRAGLSLDVDATVAAARARSWNPLDLLDAIHGGSAVTPVPAVDRSALRAAVDRLAAGVDRPRTEGSIRLGAAGKVTPVQPVDGLRLSRDRAVDALAAAYLGDYLTGGGRMALPTAKDVPEVSAATLTRAAEEVAVPATSGDLTVTVEGAQAVLTPRDIAAALTFDSDGKGSLQPVLDGESLHAAVADDLVDVETPAVDATFRIRGGTPVVVPSQQGREVLPATLASAVLPVLTRSGPARTVTLPLEPSEPSVTTEVAQGLGVVERVATYTTYYPSDFPPRLQNIHRAADLMNRTLLLPGKVFSLNRTVGERTEARGFAAGFIINNGKLEVDFGGGVSQLATTTFNTAYFAGLEIVEHNPHSFYISRYPEGRESTIAWGYKDLRFRNDSPHGVFVTTSYTNSSITVSIYGTKRYRIESVKGPRYDPRPFEVVADPRPPGTTPGTCVATSGVPGFRVVVTRIFYQHGERLKTEEFRTRYEPENEVRCGSSRPKPTPTPTPSKSG
ncbi:MAG: VanW family protein [Sporichthyaceae bacterium]